MAKYSDKTMKTSYLEALMFKKQIEQIFFSRQLWCVNSHSKFGNPACCVLCRLRMISWIVSLAFVFSCLVMKVKMRKYRNAYSFAIML